MSVPRLTAAILADLPRTVARPAYDRERLEEGVVHLGPSAFHRAHQAALFDDLAARGDRRWGVTGVSLRTKAAAMALNPQGGLYTLETRDGEAAQRRIIGSVRRVLTLERGAVGAIAALAAPQTRLVTLTITEAGYAPTDDPLSAAALIAAGLGLRRERGFEAFTVLPCDNVPANGARLEALVLAATRRRDPALADWIAQAAVFASTMADRMTPAAQPEDIAALAAQAGYVDQALVTTEPYFQWVIEDRFAGARPDFEAVGATVTKDVAPWEQAKLRLLNGAHSAMAALGGLMGLSFVHEFVAAPQRAQFIQALWDEAAVTLRPPPDLNLAAYRRALMKRFGNESLRHRLAQIALDAPRKWPQRLIAPLAERRALGLSSPALSLAIAAWIQSETPLTGRRDAKARLAAALSRDDVFPPALARDPTAQSEILARLKGLDQSSAEAAMAAAISSRVYG